MRYFAAVLVALALGGAIYYTRSPACVNTDEKVRLRLNEMAEYSYNNGCINAYIRLCDKRTDTLVRSKCQEAGIVECEVAAKGFRSWLTGQKKS